MKRRFEQRSHSACRCRTGPPSNRGGASRAAMLALGATVALSGLAAGPASADFPATINLADLDGSNGFWLAGAAAEDDAGLAVNSAGDVNGDGVDDLLIGAPRADANGTDSGASYVVFGQRGGRPGGYHPADDHPRPHRFAGK